MGGAVGEGVKKHPPPRYHCTTGESWLTAQPASGGRVDITVFERNNTILTREQAADLGRWLLKITESGTLFEGSK
jgi:hypothetical protein